MRRSSIVCARRGGLFLVLAGAQVIGMGGGGARASAASEERATSRPAAANPLPAAAPAAAQPTTRPATTQPLPLSQRPEAIERVAQYYLGLYTGLLTTVDPLARTMVVISLAMLDDPRSTEAIMEVMRKDPMPIVRIYAWEAIHARQERLTDQQRDEWVRTAYELADRGWLYGDIRIGLVGAMEIDGPTPLSKRVFQHLFLNTNATHPGDMRTLDAMGRLLAKWKSPDLIKGLIEAMSHHDSAWRAEYVLRPLVDEKVIPWSSTVIFKAGSVATWPAVQRQWADWFMKTNPREIPAGKDCYPAHSDLLPPGERITDSLDPKWRKDLELGKFTLSQLDVGFVIDSTGSMGATINWLQRDVVRIMRGFELISREPRIGVTLYRDYGDQFLVNPIPLSNRADVLAASLRSASAKGGGDIPEAVYSGLYATARVNRWSPGPKARKVIIIMGDAPPHEREVKKLEDLVKYGVREGFLIYAIKIVSHYPNPRKLPNYDPQLTTFDRIAELGHGKSFWIDFYAMERQTRRRGFAVPRAKDAPDRIIFREVLKAAMAKGYEDRVNAFVNVLEQYVERPYPEKRAIIPPWRPSGPGGPSKPRPDPQQQ